MKKTTMLAVLAPLVSAAALVPLSPSQDATVPLLSKGQKEYLSMPRKERVKYFASKEKRLEMVSYGYYPEPVTFAWAGGAPGAEYVLSVKRLPDGKTAFEGRFSETAAKVYNLEIARQYEWTVSGGGETATGRFSTEDVAPRLLRVPGVPNVRDLGGRKGLGGRRVRQGMVYRSAGLNDNATTQRVPRGNLEKAGIVPESAAEEKARIEKHIARYKAYQADPKTFPRSHAGWREWSRRHRSATVADYFKYRIAADKEELAKLEKGVKVRIPGPNRLDGPTRDYLVNTLGIKTDIDLRSDGECYGMAGSPLGPSVQWMHYSSSQYDGMQTKHGKDAFKKVFEVFLDEKNYPIDFHCIAGQDRTGAVAFILNGLLGVDEDQLYLDWEATGFWNKSTSLRHATRFDKLVSGFEKRVPGADIREKTENYVLSLGFTKDDIEKFRSIMLEP